MRRGQLNRAIGAVPSHGESIVLFAESKIHTYEQPDWEHCGRGEAALPDGRVWGEQGHGKLLRTEDPFEYPKITTFSIDPG